MKKRVTRIAVSIFLFAILGLLTWLFLPAPFEVEFAPVTRGPLSVAIHDDGIVRARDRHVVTAPSAAKLSRISLRSGEGVSAGQMLARLSPLPMSPLEREEHISRLRAAQARAGLAANEVERAREAMEKAQRDELSAAERLANGVRATDQHEQAKLALARATAEARGAAFRADAAAADMRFAELALKLAEDSGRVLDLLSPVEGTVTKIFEPGERVVQPGAKLLEISDTSRLEVVVPVLASDSVRITSGMSMFVDKWGGKGALRLRVRHVESAAYAMISAQGVEEHRVTVIADLTGAPARVVDGGRIEARIVISEKPAVLKVPASAVFRAGEGWAVFALVGNQAKRIDILPGLRNATEVEILSGLEEDAFVISSPPPALKDGSRVVSRRLKQN